MYFFTKANVIASQYFWENLSGNSQKKLCRLFSSFYNCRLSSVMIQPFCFRYKITQDKLRNYLPASGKNKFQSFQDFFTRKLANDLKVYSDFAWPCEGFVCESGKFKEIGEVNVKGNLINACNIFGRFYSEIENDSTFVNIFLHNHNYHRFHSPVDGTVLDIQFISGKLLFLRPWFYQKSKVSLPSFLNERVIIKMKDKNQKTWLICFVAGMGVGNIRLHNNIAIGSEIKIGEEIGLFLLGSTCCMSVPYSLGSKRYMEFVEVGKGIDIIRD